MDIGLVDTGYKSESGGEPHIRLAYIAAVLHQAEHKITVLDIAHSTGKEQKAFFRKPFGLIGITATSFAFVTALKVAKTIKEQNPEQKIVLGGPHVAVAQEEVLLHPEFNYAIYGEGESAIVALVDALLGGSPDSPDTFSAIHGLIFRDGHTIRVNPPVQRIQVLDTLPFPFYHPFPMQSYEYYPIATSRGCPYNCVYCASSTIWGQKWISRSPEHIILEIEQVIAQWGKKPFHIVDDTFNLQEDRIKAFCQLLLERNLRITWNASGVRADKTDPEMLFLMKSSGCTGVCIGIESANPIVLNNIGKKETIEQITEGIHRIKAAGLSCLGMFMIGNPGDTLETIQGSIQFAKTQPLDDIRFYLALPFPNTQLWDFVREHGHFLRTDYVNFHDYSGKPLFDTAEFPYTDRVHAYQLAKAAMFPPQAPQKAVSKGLTFWFHLLVEKYREHGLLFVARRIAEKIGQLLRMAISGLIRHEQHVDILADFSQPEKSSPITHSEQEDERIRTRFAPQ